MIVVVPMAGTGERYRRAGHTLPKPLIDVDGEPMVARVVAMFPGARFLFIVNRDHVRDFDLAGVLERLAPAAPIVEIEPHRDGPVETLRRAAEYLPDDDDVLVTYCDYGVVWNFQSFRERVARGDLDAAVTAYRGFHPHMMGPTLYAHLQVDGERVTAIREKGFWHDRRAEPASAGLYWFKSGAVLKELCESLVARGERVNGEYYVSMLVDAVLARGGRVGWWELERFFQWGTAEDLADYVAWARAMRGLDAHLDACAATVSPVPQVVPMAGLGKRFSDEGFEAPKPFIRAAGRTLVELSAGSLPATSRRILVARASFEHQPELPAVRDVLAAEVVTLPALTDGQARSALAGTSRLDPSSPVLVAPCDGATVYDIDAWRAIEAAPGAELVVWTAEHLPARWNPSAYGWVVADEAGRVTACDVKRPVDGVPLDRQETIVGTFFFAEAGAVAREVEAMSAEGDRVNGELYLDTVVRRWVRSGRRVRRFKVDKWLPFGTPDEWRAFAYWNDVFRDGRDVPLRASRT